MIDIIMPCYNAEKYIEETIQSVLCQTETEFKLICIDDCSNDNTHTILQRFSKQDKRICVLKNESNSGIAATRNRGIKNGKAEYIAFFDDDDIMPPERLKICKEYLDKHHNIGAVAGNYLTFDEKGKRKIVQKTRYYSASEVRGILPFTNIIPNGTTLVRRESIEKNNIWFHEEYGIEDYRFYSELVMVTDVVILPYILLEHRVMETQYSAVCTNSEQKYAARQEAFDGIHKRLIYYITDRYVDRNVNIFMRFTRESIKKIKIREILQLYQALNELKKAVKRKGVADCLVFNKSARYVLGRAVKNYFLRVLVAKR